MESPPKRITRARAAAKATGPSARTTKIVTAAAKAKTAVSTSETNKATKRKTRADEDELDSESKDQGSPPKRATRGRPKKTVQTEEPNFSVPPSRSTRGGRSGKTTGTAAVNTEAVSAPVKATRGRPRKPIQPEPATTVAPAKGSRARATAAAKPTTSTTNQTATKKTVKFQEPDKENVEPIAKKEPIVSGIRGRPAKRGAVATAVPKKPTQKSAPGDKTPLSPKKVTQVPICRDFDSEDELAGDGYSPAVKQLQKSPVKPPSKAKPFTMPSDALGSDTMDPDSTMQVNEAILNPPDLVSAPMASPARRMFLSPSKDTMKSPARKIGPVSFPSSALRSVHKAGGSEMPTPFKSSLLQSSAKRPPSPIKALQFSAGPKSQQPASCLKSSMFQSPAKRAMPGVKPLFEARSLDAANMDGSPVAKSLGKISESVERRRPSEMLLLDEDLAKHMDDDEADELFKSPIGNIRFPGRLSAVLPRDVDPDDDNYVRDGDDEQRELSHSAEDMQDAASDQMDIVVPTPAHEDSIGQSIELPSSPQATEEAQLRDGSPTAGEIVVQTDVQEEEPETSSDNLPDQVSEVAQTPLYQLRDEHLYPRDEMDSDDDDETTMHTRATPTATSLNIVGGHRRSTLGLTVLAEQFGAWSAVSPVKTPGAKTSQQSTEPLDRHGQTPAGIRSGTSPFAVNFFEDEMHVHHDEEQQPTDKADQDSPPEGNAKAMEEPIFNNMMVVNEDVALAQEANSMSLAPSNAEHSHDDTLSDASQEYGDENQVPIDPALKHEDKIPITPIRPARQQHFNTTTKVPLKPADESAPSPLKKRSFSASRVAPKRPVGPLTRNATVISYSPTKDLKRSATPQRPTLNSTPTTPQATDATKTDMWSTIGTPARTPRKDLNPALLRGAVVHVDVHTSEGADASGIFVELLNQMGARCVKTWQWNPNSTTNEESSSGKIGITHVVYKDGGKRTLEKVRQSNGVVQCVGVSWVLDCERENEWLDEASYYIDTSLIPRGGARRRKSMEPKALANMNGTLVDNTYKGSNTDGRDGQSVPNTPMNRRQSAMWMHTPSDQGDAEDDDIEWSKFILTPVPKTPAPEAISRYAADLVETPGGSNDDGDYSPTKQALITRTCPPKSKSVRYMGDEVLSREKDEQVLMRLMAARRKSLQFAPKIASPLSRAWQ